ncbi:ubiquitin carboxyl-terminal hydrolase 27 isoform X2 [Dendrobium catenatum]|uniref:ubiquitin carboxyl-terminal hydrolase 27 isoform X2 n=1 Tax=Dendrobium catenatum TaxID=906689 RepID=UPI0010A07F81|nr:ubiquitin carboxyl-terminal hydrolase 27 isoform X2 [Dendrobium catenatum]
MKHKREVSIYELINNIKNGYQVLFLSKGSSKPFLLQSILAGALGLGVGLAGLSWSRRDGYFLLPWLSDQTEPSTESLATVAGLRNLGNNCFLNCILQSLASSRCFLPFLQNLLVLDDVGDEQKAETLPLVVSLTSLLEELCVVHNEKTVVNPRNVMLAMGQYVQDFNLMRQQDAAEAFIHLLSSLEKEIIEHFIHLQHGGSLADITAFSSSRIYNQEKGTPHEFEKWKKLFIGPFDAVIGSYLRCQTCSNMLSVDLELLRSLPLSPVLDRNADIMEGCSLFDCLRHFTKLERVDDYRCGRCWHAAALKQLFYRTEKDEVKIKKLSDCVKYDSCDCKNLFCDEEISWTGISHALKKLSIIKCPKVLCFHLQRASMNCYGELVKLQGHMSFPLFLDLSAFVETATKLGQLTSVKYMHSNMKALDCALLKQQDMRMLQHFYRMVGQNPSVASLSEIKLEVPSGELLESKLLEAASVDNSEKMVTELAADLDQTCIIPERGYSEKVGIARSSASCMYQLRSVVEHYGRPGSGHYAVYRRMESQLSFGAAGELPDSMNGSWVYISDTKVKRISLEDVLAAEASMLFYEKVEADIHESEFRNLT